MNELLCMGKKERVSSTFEIHGFSLVVTNLRKNDKTFSEGLDFGAISAFKGRITDVIYSFYPRIKYSQNTHPFRAQ